MSSNLFSQIVAKASALLLLAAFASPLAGQTTTSAHTDRIDNLITSSTPGLDIRAAAFAGGATTGASDNTAAIQAAVTAACTSTNRNILVPGVFHFTGTVQISCTGIVFDGLSGYPLSLSGANGFSYDGNGTGFQLGTEDTPYKVTISSIVRASNVVTVTFTTNDVFTSGQINSTAGLIYVRGVTDTSFDTESVVITALPTSNSVQFAQVGPDASSSGGTVDLSWDAAYYPDTAQGLVLKNMAVTCGSSSHSALLNGDGNYATNAIFMRDWRSGSVTWNRVSVSTCQYPFFGITSDRDNFMQVSTNHNARGIYLGPRSDQTDVDIEGAFNDADLELDSVYNIAVWMKNTNSSGTPTDAPLRVYANWSRGTSNIVFYQTWLEHNVPAATSTPSFFDIGVNSTFPVKDVHIEYPVVANNATGANPKATYMARVDNAAVVDIKRPSSRGDSNSVTLDGGLLDFVGTHSPAASVDVGAATFTPLSTNSGSGFPVVTAYGAVGANRVSPVLTSGTYSIYNVLSARNSISLFSDPTAGAQLSIFDSRNSSLASVSFFGDTGTANYKVSPLPSDATQTASIQFFRSTNTTGSRILQVYRGDNTATVMATLNAALGTLSLAGGIDDSAQASSFLKIKDQGSCAMTAGACSAQTLGHTYTAAPNCFVTWNGTGTLTGFPKAPSTTTTVTPASSVGTDTAVVNWFCLGS